MTVENFISIADECHDKSIAVVRKTDKFLGTYKLPQQGPSKTMLELFDVTHYNGIYIEDYASFTIPLNTISELFIE